MIDIVSLLTALATLHPRPDFERRRGDAVDVAAAVAATVDAEHPVFGSAELDAAVMLETAWAEARFDRDAVGDGGRSGGTFQIGGVSRWAPLDVQARIAYARLRASAAACDAPLAVYASGSCSNRRGRAISAERMAEARAVVALARPVAVDEGVAERQP